MEGEEFNEINEKVIVALVVALSVMMGHVHAFLRCWISYQNQHFHRKSYR